MSGRPAIAVLALLAAVSSPRAQVVSGHAFEDRNANGIQDAGEPSLAGVGVELFGTRDAGGAFDQTVTTPANGVFSFSPGNGCYLLLPSDPAGWRMSASRTDGVAQSTPGYTFPDGKPRFGKLDLGTANLKSGALRYASMGDSIGWNWNSCFYTASFWYSSQIQSRLACTAPAAVVTLDKTAVKGEHTDDLLVDDTADQNNVFRAIANQPDLVTISMIGNDLLNVEPPASPTQAQINKAVAEVLDARQNLQEALSALTSQIPGADITLNTLYDNLAWNCYAAGSQTFHRQWLPIVNQILRDLAWGQTRRASVNEAASEFARADQNNACTGFDKMICRDIFQTDNIHPNNNGYTVMREKVWEADGGVNLGPKDALARTSITAADYGFLRRVRRLYPATWQTLAGASVSNPAAALTDQDAGAAAAITLGSGSEEFRLSGFPDWYDEIVMVKTIAGVRYRTTGTVADDFYRMEASVNDQFRPPGGFSYSPTNWNWFTPIVGGGGPNKPVENPDYPTEKLLVVPAVAAFRDVSATLTRNPVLPPGGADYTWPAVNQDDLTTATIRVASAPVAGTSGNDNYQISLDAAWLDVYGWEKPRPAEVTNLRVAKAAAGALDVSFDALAGAQRYNLYFGTLAAVHAGAYDHGAPAAPAAPLCGATTTVLPASRRGVSVSSGQQPGTSSYMLVTAHVSDVESPSGTRSDTTEISRAQSTCR